MNPASQAKVLSLITAAVETALELIPADKVKAALALVGEAVEKVVVGEAFIRPDPAKLTQAGVTYAEVAADIAEDAKFPPGEDDDAQP